jgi:hypothetical protein
VDILKSLDFRLAVFKGVQVCQYLYMHACIDVCMYIGILRNVIVTPFLTNHRVNRLMTSQYHFFHDLCLLNR